MISAIILSVTILSIVMISAIKLSVIILNVVGLSAIKLSVVFMFAVILRSVIMLNVVAPFEQQEGMAIDKTSIKKLTLKIVMRCLNSKTFC
jgi:hypothetical protein